MTSLLFCWRPAMPISIRCSHCGTSFNAPAVACPTCHKPVFINVQTTGPVIDAVDAVRRVINRWSREGFFRGFFRICDLGDQIAVNHVISHIFYTVRLKTQYETRTVSTGQVPYGGGSIDNTGVRPDPMTMPVDRPTDFKKRRVRQTVPHTDRLASCSRCSGVGTVPCPVCQGSGRGNCFSCNGVGWREQLHTTGTGTYTVREKCGFCTGGIVVCGCCNGGQQKCGNCDGLRLVRTYQELAVQFHFVSEDVPLGTPTGLGRLTVQTEGQVIFQQRFESGKGFSGAPAAVEGRLRKLVYQANTAGGAGALVLFQQVQVEKVPADEVVYEYRGSPERRLWIYGDRQHVYAPGVPRPWGKIALTSAAAVLLTAAALFAVFWLVGAAQPVANKGVPDQTQADQEKAAQAQARQDEERRQREALAGKDKERRQRAAEAQAREETERRKREAEAQAREEEERRKQEAEARAVLAESERRAAPQFRDAEALLADAKTRDKGIERMRQVVREFPGTESANTAQRLLMEIEAEAQARREAESRKREAEARAALAEAEKLAAPQLGQAKNMLADEKTRDEGIVRLRLVVKEFAGTESAKSAQRLLDEMDGQEVVAARKLAFAIEIGESATIAEKKMTESAKRIRENWRDALLRIVINYPDTKAAKEARRLLERAFK